jgi:hypothetical protein
MSGLKAILHGCLLGAVFPIFIQLVCYEGVRLLDSLLWSLCLTGFVLGMYVSRFISWGWSLGGGAGFLIGLFGPLPIGFIYSDTSYERVLPWLLISAVIGLLAGGRTLDQLFTRRALRKKTPAPKHHN